MKLYFIIIGSLVLFSGKTAAQSRTRNTDSSAVFKMIERADYFLEKGRYDSALLMTDGAVELAKEKKIYRGQGWALSKTVEVLIEQKQLINAEQLALQAHKISNMINDTLLNGVSLMQLGQIKMYDNQPDKAILLLDKSIASGLGKFPNLYLALAFSDLGYAWGMKDEYENQADFTHKSLAIYEKLSNDAGMAMALGNLSAVYYNMGQKEKAIEYGKQSLKYREKTGDVARLSVSCCNLSQYFLGINIDEAVRYQELCIKYARQSGQESRIIHSYITSSLVANGKKNNKEAFEYEIKVIELLEKSKSDQPMLARRYIAAAIYNDNLKYDSLVTINYYNKAISLSKELGNRQNLKDAYLYFSNFHNRKKNFSEALINYKKHILYRDSLMNIEKEERIAQLEKQYETTRKDIEIERLNNDQKIKQLEIEKQKAIIAGNNAVALQRQNEIDLLSKSQELQDAKIRQQEEELEKKELLATASQQQLELSQKEKQLQERKIINQRTLRNLLLAGLGLVLLLGYTYFNRYQLKKKLEQQQTLLAMRNTISRDLHDDIGASLSNINILNELARRNSGQPEKAKEYLSKASEDVQRISESLSDIVWNINPKYDDLQNLFVRMKRYAADMLDGKDIKGHFDFPADESSVQLSMTQRRDLYLIFKEAINNLVKYSGAREATVKLNTGRHKITLQIADDGKGFDKELVRTGNGLLNMEQRAKASGGILQVRTAPGKGTIVEIEMEVT